MRRSYRHMILATVMAAALMIQMNATPALAHEEPASSNPAADSTIPVSPEQVVVSFPGEIEADGSSFEVRGPDGEAIGDAGRPDLDNADRNTLIATVPENLEPGEYTVEWVVVDAEDGHETDGSFTFTIDPDAPEQASPVITEPEVTPEEVDVESDDDDGGIGRGTLIVGGVAIFVALIVVATFGRRAFWR